MAQPCVEYTRIEKTVCAQSLQSGPPLCNIMTVALLSPLSLGFPRQEYWSGFPRSFPGDLPNPGIEPATPALQADSL